MTVRDDFDHVGCNLPANSNNDMLRCFFDTDDGRFLHRDRDGQMVTDLDAARHLALAALSEMVGDGTIQNADRAVFTIDVRNEAGRVFFTASMSLLSRWLV